MKQQKFASYSRDYYGVATKVMRLLINSKVYKSVFRLRNESIMNRGQGVRYFALYIIIQILNIWLTIIYIMSHIKISKTTSSIAIARQVPIAILKINLWFISSSALIREN